MKKLEENLLDFFRKHEIKYVEVNYVTANAGAKKCWNALNYRTYREQARKEI